MRVAIVTTATFLVASGVSAAPFFVNSGELGKSGDQDHSDAKWTAAQTDNEKAGRFKDAYVAGGPSKFPSGPGPQKSLTIGGGLIRPEPGQPPVPIQPQPGTQQTGTAMPTHRVEHYPNTDVAVSDKNSGGMSTSMKLGLGLGIPAGVLLGGGALLCVFKMFGLCKAAKDLSPSVKINEDILGVGKIDKEQLLTHVPSQKVQEAKPGLLASLGFKSKSDKTVQAQAPIFQAPSVPSVPSSTISRREIVYVKDV